MRGREAARQPKPRCKAVADRCGEQWELATDKAWARLIVARRKRDDASER